MQLRKQYSKAEVGKFLKISEYQPNVPSRQLGHAEGRHVLQAVGRGRHNVTEQGLLDRAVSEMKEAVGAFSGDVTEAVTFALNLAAGQNALGYLEPDSVDFVFAVIDVQSQNFPMSEARADVATDLEYGTAIAASPLGVWKQTVRCVAMKLMKDSTHQQLHIRTAYPMSAMPARGSYCKITYSTGAQPQTLPI